MTEEKNRFSPCRGARSPRDPEVNSMKKTLALLLALLWLGMCACAEVPQLSGNLFDAAKLAARRLDASHPIP